MNNVNKAQQQQQQQLVRGAIYMVNLPNAGGSIQQNTRPCVLISNNMANKFSSVLHICPISSQVTSKSKLPTHIRMSSNCGLQRESIALCEQVMLVNKSTIMNKVGFCDTETMERINQGILIQFSMAQINNNIAYA